MQLAIVENNTIVKVGYYQDLFPNTSFPANGLEPKWLTENNVLEVNLFIEHDRVIEKLIPVEAYIDNGKVYAVKVEAKTEEEISTEAESKKVKIRAQRNELLKQSDWTQVDDSVVDKAAWASYRQALRDITQQEGFPDSISWPEQPGVV